MAEQQLRPKFLRAFFATPATTSVNATMLYFLRVVYEFWNFCVNGTNDLKVPGGVSTSHTTGSYINMPTGWESGSTVLRASGSDGATWAGTTLFSATLSAPFSASYKGMYLTIWQSGSTSTDDSIYPIVEWINSSSIMIDPTYGGTVSGVTGSVPQMTSRTNLNYRVIDYHAASNLTPLPSTGWMIFQFNGASDVNPGQKNSQFRLSSNISSVYWDNLVIRLSPSGSWDGTQFLGPHENSEDILLERSFAPGGGGWGILSFFHASAGGTGYITLIADKSFYIAQTGGDWAFPATSAFMVEVPKRLYPQEMDPNPICAISFGSMDVQTAGGQGFAWSSRWMPSPYDTTMRRYQGTIPCYQGGYWAIQYHSNYRPQSMNYHRWPTLYNRHLNRHVVPSTTLTLGNYLYQGSQPTQVDGKTSVARVRVRSQKNMPGGLHKLARIDDGTNKWIHVGAGVLWPWDNAIVPNRHLFRGHF